MLFLFSIRIRFGPGLKNSCGFGAHNITGGVDCTCYYDWWIEWGFDGGTHQKYISSAYKQIPDRSLYFKPRPKVIFRLDRGWKPKTFHIIALTYLAHHGI